MDVALSHATRGMTEQGRNGQLGKIEIAGQAGEGVAQRMRRDICQAG